MKTHAMHVPAVLITSCAAVLAIVAQSALATPSPDLAQVQKHLAAMSVPFVPNAGQWDARAAFAAKTLNGTLFVTTEGKLVYSLPAASALPGVAELQGEATDRQAWSLSESFATASGKTLHAAPAGFRPGVTKISYFHGRDTARHRSGIDTYERVNLGDVYKGVNVQLRATGSNVEKIFTVAPRQDPRQIRLKLEGATKLEVGGNGELIAHTGNGPVTWTAPIAFQDNDDGTRRDVGVRYAVDTATQTYGFALGAYDRSRPLVIDPLLYSTYLGGNGADFAWAVAIHPRTGDVYVAGQTSSATFPQIAGGANTTRGGAIDGFISRLSGDLKTLYQSTYIGGTGDDTILALAIHPAPFEIYVGGWTTSADFPFTPSFVDQPDIGGNRDGFVARVGPDLTAIRIATFIGGSGDDEVRALAIHPHNGDIYAAGVAGSSATFPVSAGAPQTDFGGGTNDAFVSRMAQDFSTPRTTTLFGGSGNDQADALTIHPRTGDVYIGGHTASANLPGITSNSAQQSKPGPFAGYVARFDSNLSGPMRATYLTGGTDDTVYALAVHPVTGEVIAAGVAGTPASGLPGLSGSSPQPNNAGQLDAFVSRLTPALDAVPRSTFLGGTANDQARAVVVHPSGEIIVAGHSNSTAFTTPASALAIQGTPGASDDYFVARYTSDLRFRTQVTHLGVGGLDVATALAVSPVNGDIVVAGYTSAGSFPGTVAAAPTSYGGSNDAVVTRLSSDLTAVNTIPSPVAFIAQSNVAPLTMRTSNEILMANVPVGFSNFGSAFVFGQPGSQRCATTISGCCTNNLTEVAQCGGFVTGWTSAPYTQLEAGDYLAVRHPAPASGTAVTTLVIGGKAIPFVTSSGDASLLCNLDMNADHELKPGVEGLIALRALFGLKGGSAITPGTEVLDSDWDALRAAINAYCGTGFQ